MVLGTQQGDRRRLTNGRRRTLKIVHPALQVCRHGALRDGNAAEHNRASSQRSQDGVLIPGSDRGPAFRWV